jgi:molybdate transport system regulatory protein
MGDQTLLRTCGCGTGSAVVAAKPDYDYAGFYQRHTSQDSLMQDHSGRRDLRLEVRSKIWIERGEDVVLSAWRIELLEAIEAHGSLSRAAIALDIPYRTAWERVKEMEAKLGVRLLESESGGAGGGGSRLTPAASDLCARFHRVSHGIQEVIASRFATEFGDLDR